MSSTRNTVRVYTVAELYAVSYIHFIGIRLIRNAIFRIVAGMNVCKACRDVPSQDAVRTSPGLPSEQHAALLGRQKMERLYRRGERHADDASESKYGTYTITVTCSICYSVYLPLTGEERSHRSKMRYATRKALASSTKAPGGCNFDGNDSAGRESSVYTDGWEYSDQEEPIPQKYIDDINKTWHEDEEDNDATQYLADVMDDAPWRTHAPMRPLYNADGEFPAPDWKYWADRKPRSRCETYEASYVCEVELSATIPMRTTLVSTFSFDEDDDGEDKLTGLKSPIATIGKALVKSLRRSRRSSSFTEKRYSEQSNKSRVPSTCGLQASFEATVERPSRYCVQ